MVIPVRHFKEVRATMVFWKQITLAMVIGPCVCSAVRMQNEQQNEIVTQIVGEIVDKVVESCDDKLKGEMMKECEAKYAKEVEVSAKEEERQLAIEHWQLKMFNQTNIDELDELTKKKKGWGPSSIEFVDGGKKMVILRLQGKEMGTPFLIRCVQ